MKELAAILILLPLISSACCYLIRPAGIRSFIVLATGGVLAVCSVLLIPYAPFTYSPKDLFGLGLHGLVGAADFLLLFIILYFGFKHRNWIIKILAVFQILALAYLEALRFGSHADSQAIFYCDNLTLIMLMVVSIVGSIICFQAIPYMKNHEEHLHLTTSAQPRFFAITILFLGAMNGLVLSNDLTFFYFFFELTTLCSFLLIGHDKTEIAIGNSVRALWMNSLGGAAFIVALLVLYRGSGNLDMQNLVTSSPKFGLFQLAMALLCFASFTKSAQFPFQSWLLGAMVAPTPVSALLHSSTMVKVGVYLVLRLSPAFHGTLLSYSVALFGAFTFLAAAALAIGQSNGKKVLAYSTISNLGLIVSCAGFDSAVAITAAILLIIFHAATKALLFLCVGAIEQRIESRDIEDMRGLYSQMPVTALITVMGVIMMIMPPFGMLLGKWMALQSAAGDFWVIILLALGSALTVLYWARWAGTLMSDPFAGRFKPERQHALTWTALGSLCAGAGILSVAV
ncbi:MAG: NADH-quinone oxidoreductase subunit L, partial [Syntrophobacteraceae bacterium]